MYPKYECICGAAYFDTVGIDSCACGAGFVEAVWYVCEACGDVFTTQDAAESCEESHNEEPMSEAEYWHYRNGDFRHGWTH